VPATVREGNVVDGGGALLGYELLGWDVTNFHSWICNLPSTSFADLQWRPNSLGFIQRADEAYLLAARANELTETGGEPVTWFPGAVLDYSVSEDNTDPR